MPIILLWNSFALPHQPPFARWLKQISVSGALIQGWLRKRTAEGERIERATAGFPVFRFYNQALTARIDTLQRGAIVTEPNPGLGDSMRSVGDAWRIDRVFANRVREARLIGLLMGVVADVTQTALDSVIRWENPQAAQFNPRNARFSDLFGMGALTFRALGTGRDVLEASGRRIHAALYPPAAAPASGGIPAGGAPGAPAPAPGAAEPAPEAGASALPLDLQLDEALRYIAGALLVVPGVCAIVMDLGRDLLVWLRRELIDMLFSLEQRAFDFRQNLLAGIHNGLAAFSQTAVELMVIARDYALGHIRHWARFGVAYLESVTQGVSAFADQFGTFWNGVDGLIRAMMNYTERLMSIDLGEVIHNLLLLIENANNYVGFMLNISLEPDEEYSAPGQFPVTIADLVLNEGNGPRARDHLGRGAHALGTTLREATGSGIVLDLASWGVEMDLQGMIAGIGDLLPRLNTAPLPARAQPVLVYSTAAEPDLAAGIIDPLRTGFSAAVTDLGNGARLGIEGVTVGLLHLLDGAAANFHAAALNAARLGSLGQYGRIVAGSEALVARAFPDAPAAAPSAFTGIARAFSLWLSGAFDSIGTIMGGYLGFVLDEWQQHLEQNTDTPAEVTPTSPRILLERARLGRVHMPELRIVAGSRPTDRALADLVAARFQGAVRDAYVAGKSAAALAA